MDQHGCHLHRHGNALMKKLCVYDSVTRRIQALDPARASGVPIPAFRSGIALPSTGSIAGEAFLNSNTGEASVWNGNQWNPIARPVISYYPTEAVLLGDTPSDVTVAIATATGNAFSRVNGGWRAMGARIFQTALARDMSHDEPGTIAFVQDTGEWALRVPSGFVIPDSSKFAPDVTNDADLANVISAIIQQNRQGLWFQLDPAYAYPGAVGGGTINQIPQPMDGANGDWVIFTGSQFIQVDGSVIAAGNPVPSSTPIWAVISQQQVTVGPTAPSSPLVGQQWFDNTSRTLFTYDGTRWVPPSSGVPVGTIIQHASVQAPPGYLFCDGSLIPAGSQYDDLRALIGPNVPDLIGHFLRGSSTQALIDGFTQRQDTTRLPRKGFTGITGQQGAHQHGLELSRTGNWVEGHAASAKGIWPSDRNFTDGSPSPYNGYISSAGAHTHTLTINGGGDAETAPHHVLCAFHIRAIA